MSQEHEHLLHNQGEFSLDPFFANAQEEAPFLLPNRYICQYPNGEIIRLSLSDRMLISSYAPSSTPTRLTPQETIGLYLSIRDPYAFVPLETYKAYLYGKDTPITDKDDKAIERIMTNLRNKIDPSGENQVMYKVKHVGYSLSVDMAPPTVISWKLKKFFENAKEPVPESLPAWYTHQFSDGHTLAFSLSNQKLISSYTYQQEAIEVTDTEAILLYLLLRNPNDIVSYKTMKDYIWGKNIAVDDTIKQTIVVNLSNVRKKINPSGTPRERKVINAIPSLGFTLAESNNALFDAQQGKENALLLSFSGVGYSIILSPDTHRLRLSTSSEDIALTQTQTEAMVILLEHTSISSKELAHRLGITKDNLHEVIYDIRAKLHAASVSEEDREYIYTQSNPKGYSLKKPEEDIQ